MPYIKILSIDKDKEYWEPIAGWLATKGYSVTITGSVKEALCILRKTTFRLVILDSNIPEVDYIDLIKEIKNDYDIPLIVVCENCSPMDAIVGLEVGADDYMNKPFEMRELAARIKANLRLAERWKNNGKIASSDAAHHKGSKIQFGKWVLDRDKMRVVKEEDQSPVNLTAGEYQLLEALVLSPGKVLSREKLFEMTRSDEFEAYDRAVDIQIGRIRKKLGENARNPNYLKTIRGAGYMLDLDVQKKYSP